MKLEKKFSDSERNTKRIDTNSMKNKMNKNKELTLEELEEYEYIPRKYPQR